MTEQNLWEKIVDKLEKEIDSQYFATWLSPARFASFSENILTLEVPSTFHRDWLSNHYLSLIQKKAGEISGNEIRIKFEINTSVAEPPVEDASLKKKVKRVKNPFISSSLDNKYIFDNFIVGTSNHLAHAACVSCSEKPGTHYNPLFIYGGVGLGKTHLLNAIGHGIFKKNPNVKICYLSAERFMNDMIASIRYDKMEQFRTKYRVHSDVLLMDDVHFLGGKEGTQEEFFHTFNALYESKKQIVITADKFPSEIPYLEERLRSRFEWGLIADIQPPEIETRIAILKKKAEVDDIDLPNDVAIYIAEGIRSNIRQLEGALLRLESYSSLTNEKITIEMAKKVLTHILKMPRKVISIESIQSVVSNFFNISVGDLKSAKRTKVIALPRQIAMYLGKKHIGLSTPEIGRAFGGRDHSTVIHALQKIERKMKEDKQLQFTLESLEKNIEM
ncbi:MAG: chromosomal replication initiator protein DnaA [Pseudomonadota bacterium]